MLAGVSVDLAVGGCVDLSVDIHGRFRGQVHGFSVGVSVSVSVGSAANVPRDAAACRGMPWVLQ